MFGSGVCIKAYDSEDSKLISNALYPGKSFDWVHKEGLWDTLGMYILSK